MRKPATAATIGLLLFGLIWWFVPGGENEVNQAAKGPSGVLPTALKVGPRRAESALDPPPSPHLKKAILSREAFLDSICPSLSPSEETEILAKCERSARCLVGLALLKRPPNRAYLEEALRNFPDDPLVNYALIGRGFPGFDVKRAALAMDGLFPDSALPSLLLANEAFESEDQIGASKLLKQAAGKNDQFPFPKVVRELKEEMLASAGRDVDALRKRINLDVLSEPPFETLLQLGVKLGIKLPSFSPTEETKELLPALLSLYQNTSFNESVSILDRAPAISIEGMLLKSLYDLYRDNPPEGMFGAPLSQLVREAEAEEGVAGMLSEFGYDKTSLYQRIPPAQQQEFNRLIGQLGEPAAFRWLLQINPDVFIDPDYPPSSPNGVGGIPKADWEGARFAWLKRAKGG